MESTIEMAKTDEPHPLLFNSVVLRTIFGYLDLHTLKSTRLTCSFWKKEADFFVAEKSQIVISWYELDDDESESHNENTTRPVLSTFLKYMDSVSPEHVLFRNYTLLAESNLFPRTGDPERFWRECGMNVHRLCLNSLDFYDASEVRNILFKWTPNMKSLSIEYGLFRSGHCDSDVSTGNSDASTKDTESEKSDTSATGSETENNDTSECSSTESECTLTEFDSLANVPKNLNFQSFSLYPLKASQDFPIPWREIFTAYPNMETLRVDSVLANEGDDNIKKLLEELVEFQKENPKGLDNLKQMHVFSAMSDQDTIYRFIPESKEHFDIAMQLDLKLESFALASEGRNEESYFTSVRQYIKKLSPSLKSLKLTSTYYSFPLFPVFPLGRIVVFPELTNFTVGMRSLWTGNLDFLPQSTPKLKTLKIESISLFGNISMTPTDLVLNTNMAPMNTLVCLDLYDKNQAFLTGECVRKIGEWFPNLTQFSAVLDDESLCAVSGHFQDRLKELNVYGTFITDGGITGNFVPRPKDDDDEDEDEGFSGKKPRLDDGYLMGRIAVAPVCNLRRLQKLTIGWGTSFRGCYTCTVELTNNAVYTGLVNLKELNHIHLPNTKITKSAFEDLCDQVNLITLDTPKYCRGVTYDEIGGRTRI